MSEYEKSSTIQASPEAVFDFVTNVANLPRFMPTTERAQVIGDEHVRVEGTAKGHAYSANGSFHADPSTRRLEWKADEGYYDGWLQVNPVGDGNTSEVIVHIALQGYAPGTSPQERPSDEQIERGLTNALEAIKSSVETA